MTQPPKLLDRVRTAIRVRHYSPRTEEAYVTWIRRYILYHGKRHPSAMGADEVNAFLSHLAVDRTVSASTQNQALSALLFLYRNVLEEPLPWIDDIVRAQRPERLPVVLTIDEVRQVVAEMPPPAKLVVQLLYGSGLRLLEALMLRVKDVDFARGQLTVRDPKWKHDRTTMLPRSVTAELHEQLVQARLRHQDDLACGWGETRLPDATRAEIPLGGAGVAVAVGISGDETMAGRRRAGMAASSARDRRAESGHGCRPGGWNRQAGHLSQFPALLRHPSAPCGDTTSGPCRSCWATATWRRP